MSYSLIFAFFVMILKTDDADGTDENGFSFLTPPIEIGI
jgi:hypothetical protein